MFETYSPGDMVYLQGIGFSQLVNCGKHKMLKLKRNLKYNDALNPLSLGKKKSSLYFDPLLFDDSELIKISSDSEAIAFICKLSQQLVSLPQPQPIPIQQPQTDQQPNIVILKLYHTQYLIYAPDTKISQHIHIKVKTMFCNRQQYSLYININSTILQLKNKVIQLTKQPISNLDNIRLISTNGYIQQLSNNKQLIYQCRMVTNNSTLLLLANVRFSISDKGENIVLTNNNRTASKKIQEGKYQICLGTIDISNGKVYFETKIDKIGEDDDLFVGVAKRGIALSGINLQLYKSPFWGYNCMGGRIITGTSLTDIPSTRYLSQFGNICKHNDNIGTLIQVKNKIATISYYVNNKYIGKAFQGIQCPVTPAIVLGSGDIQVTINSLPDAPFDASAYLNQSFI